MADVITEASFRRMSSCRWAACAVWFGYAGPRWTWRGKRRKTNRTGTGCVRALATDCWSMTVVMLTGASEFLGLHILQRLLGEGDQVHALVRRPEKLRENLALLGVDPNDSRIQMVTGDMTDAAAGRGPAGGEQLQPGHPRRRSVTRQS
jgi:hypothetical protein